VVGKLLRIIFIVVVAGYFFSMLATYFSYIEPYIFPLKMLQGEARPVTENIIIGPYPHEKDIEKLVKVNNVKVIISLLDPSIPFEESLLKKEKDIADKYGIKFYNVPIYFIRLRSPANYAGVSKIRKIIEKHSGEKVYIHCYLGRHRVKFVADMLLGVAQ